MVTVIIPALNEEETIYSVIQLVKGSSLVSEIIVVDDKSLDRTLEIARSENVKVITSTCLGKGASMREGMLLSSNETLVFLDADIVNYPADIVERLTLPILNGEADFVKSTFNRQAGRVTELVAKPLLSILFPELSRFSQPLSGMIAGKKSVLSDVDFENDYGVDIGIMIDVFLSNVRIAEVNIGTLENRMQDLSQLGKMSREVSKSILKRVKDLPSENLKNIKNIKIIRDQMDFAIKESLSCLTKMAVFDMDHTILLQSFIKASSEEFGFQEKLKEIQESDYHPTIRTKHIARLLKGKNIAEILELVDKIPIVSDIAEVVENLKERGFICGIISDSYDCVTNHLKNRLGFDFSLANELEFSNSVATGEVKIPSFFIKNRSSECVHDYCKGNALKHVARKYKVKLSNVMCIGDGDNDLCMMRLSGFGVSFCSPSLELEKAAQMTIREKSFKALLHLPG